tara:strand:+ start:84 stop:368 length:285 start_codon:yes stop_codon:yes gene_type:complete
MAEEPKHILDLLLEQTRTLIPKDIEIYLAEDDETNQVVAVRKGEFQRGMGIEQIVHSYGVFRIYQADTEEEAIKLLAENLSASIEHMLEEFKVK